MRNSPRVAIIIAGNYMFPSPLRNAAGEGAWQAAQRTRGTRIAASLPRNGRKRKSDAGSRRGQRRFPLHLQHQRTKIVSVRDLKRSALCMNVQSGFSPAAFAPIPTSQGAALKRLYAKTGLPAAAS